MAEKEFQIKIGTAADTSGADQAAGALNELKAKIAATNDDLEAHRQKAQDVRNEIVEVSGRVASYKQQLIELQQQLAATSDTTGGTGEAQQLLEQRITATRGAIAEQQKELIGLRQSLSENVNETSQKTRVLNGLQDELAVATKKTGTAAAASGAEQGKLSSALGEVARGARSAQLVQTGLNLAMQGGISSVRGLILAFRGLSAALLTNPLTAAIAAVGLLVTGLLALKNRLEETRQRQQETADASGQLATALLTQAKAADEAAKARDLSQQIEQADALAKKFQDAARAIELVRIAQQKLAEAEFAADIAGKEVEQAEALARGDTGAARRIEAQMAERRGLREIQQAQEGVADAQLKRSQLAQTVETQEQQRAAAQAARDAAAQRVAEAEKNRQGLIKAGLSEQQQLLKRLEDLEKKGEQNLTEPQLQELSRLREARETAKKTIAEGAVTFGAKGQEAVAGQITEKEAEEARLVRQREDQRRQQQFLEEFRATSGRGKALVAESLGVQPIELEKLAARAESAVAQIPKTETALGETRKALEELRNQQRQIGRPGEASRLDTEKQAANESLAAAEKALAEKTAEQAAFREQIDAALLASAAAEKELEAATKKLAATRTELATKESAAQKEERAQEGEVRDKEARDIAQAQLRVAELRAVDTTQPEEKRRAAFDEAQRLKEQLAALESKTKTPEAAAAALPAVRAEQAAERRQFEEKIAKEKEDAVKKDKARADALAEEAKKKAEAAAAPPGEIEAAPTVIRRLGEPAAPRQQIIRGPGAPPLFPQAVPTTDPDEVRRRFQRPLPVAPAAPSPFSVRPAPEGPQAAAPQIDQNAVNQTAQNAGQAAGQQITAALQGAFDQLGTSLAASTQSAIQTAVAKVSEEFDRKLKDSRT